MQSFWYLASPYAKYPHGIEAAFIVACEASALLIRSKVSIYSPITHTHPIALYGGLDPKSHDVWMPVDEVFMRLACGLIVLKAEGWEASHGICLEMTAFRKYGRPVVYMEVGTVPDVLIPQL